MSEPTPRPNPFPGLRPFETAEYRLFFGREGQADALIERLERSRFLAVVGASGSGKSSLVRAGLLPGLLGGMMAGAGAGWRVAVLRPGHDPFGNLARALAGDGVLPEAGAGLSRGEREAVIEATLRRGSLGLVEAVGQARLGGGAKLLVVVDQFEELFRFRAARAALADDDASAFVKLLLEAARQRGPGVYVVLTMRSDFLGDCAQFQGLPEAINDGQYLIPRMTRDERRFAITGPARVARARISEPLVGRLLNDVGDNPDQLPILQHALMRTWEEWREKRPAHAAAHAGEALDVCCYEAIGGMADALSLHAEEAYAELGDDSSRRLAELLFKALTERGPDNREIRRPTRLGEICEIAGARTREEVERVAAEVVAVVEVFRREGRSFLMPPPPAPLTPETIVDISHESLIRNWLRLRDWVRDEAEAARIYRRLAEAAGAHRAGESGLLDDVTLAWVNRWRERYAPSRAWGVRYHPDYDEALAYFDESRRERDRERAEREREREEHERQRHELLERERREREQAERHAAEQAAAARRIRLVAVALGVVFVCALAALAAAVVAQRRAAAAQQSVELARYKLAKSRTASRFIQSYELEQAERELGELYAMTLNDREGHENRAWVFYSLGDLNRRLDRHDQAQAFFTSALQTEMLNHGRLGLDSVGTLDSLAHTLELQKKYPAAIAHYEQLLRLLDAAVSEKGRYFKLNAANVHSDLADLYIEQAYATGPAVDAETRRKVWQEMQKALQIWEDVLKDDPEAMSEKYQEAVDKLERRVMPGVPMSEYNALYRPRLEEIRVRQETLAGAATAPTGRLPIGPPNPGGDPAVSEQLAREGPGYRLFDPLGENAYGRPQTAAFVRALAAEWGRRHPDLKLVVGDLSRRGGGPLPAHGHDHQDGREADIWPLTNNGQPEPTNTYAPNYSRELTVELVRLIRDLNPGAVVYFDDADLVSAGLVRATLDHNNHLHVLLP